MRYGKIYTSLKWRKRHHGLRKIVHEGTGTGDDVEDETVSEGVRLKLDDFANRARFKLKDRLTLRSPLYMYFQSSEGMDEFTCCIKLSYLKEGEPIKWVTQFGHIFVGGV